MINYVEQPNDLEEIKRDRLLWIRKSLQSAIDRLPNNPFNESRRRSIEEIDKKLGDT